jgi:hypothetical protein
MGVHAVTEIAQFGHVDLVRTLWIALNPLGNQLLSNAFLNSYNVPSLGQGVQCLDVPLHLEMSHGVFLTRPLNLHQHLTQSLRQIFIEPLGGEVATPLGSEPGLHHGEEAVLPELLEEIYLVHQFIAVERLLDAGGYIFLRF